MKYAPYIALGVDLEVTLFNPLLQTDSLDIFFIFINDVFYLLTNYNCYLNILEKELLSFRFKFGHGGFS